METEEKKNLLLKDLCARLPYRPILNWKFIDNTSKDEELKELSDLYIWWITKAQDCEIKPYLRPMSSMTEEEKKEFSSLINKVEERCINAYGKGGYTFAFIEVNDWLNAHHFDYRGLIPMGLALEAPEGMYNIQNISTKLEDAV